VFDHAGPGKNCEHRSDFPAGLGAEAGDSPELEAHAPAIRECADWNRWLHGLI
jgi:hypothetical protein